MLWIRRPPADRDGDVDMLAHELQEVGSTSRPGSRMAFLNPLRNYTSGFIVPGSQEDGMNHRPLSIRTKSSAGPGSAQMNQSPPPSPLAAPHPQYHVAPAHHQSDKGKGNV